MPLVFLWKEKKVGGFSLVNVPEPVQCLPWRCFQLVFQLFINARQQEVLTCGPIRSLIPAQLRDIVPQEGNILFCQCLKDAAEPSILCTQRTRKVTCKSGTSLLLLGGAGSWKHLLEHTTLEPTGVLDHNHSSSSNGLTPTHLKSQDRKWIPSSILLLWHTVILFIGGH